MLPFDGEQVNDTDEPLIVERIEYVTIVRQPDPIEVVEAAPVIIKERKD